MVDWPAFDHEVETELARGETGLLTASSYFMRKGVRERHTPFSSQHQWHRMSLLSSYHMQLVTASPSHLPSNRDGALGHGRFGFLLTLDGRIVDKPGEINTNIYLNLKMPATQA